MTAGFAHKRRAEEFDALLSGDPAATTDPEFAELLALVATMRSVPEVAARPAYVADLRSRLVAAAAAQEVRVVDDAVAARLTPRQKTSTRRERRVATVLGGFALASAATSMAVASQGALPGDLLYPVKRAIENAETNLQGDESARAATVLGHAEQRLSEVKELSRSDTDAARLATALQDLTDQANEAGSLAIDNYEADGDTDGITELRAFTARGLTELTAMSDAVPEDARGALVTAAQTLRQIDSAAWQACPTCGESPTELPDLSLLASLDGLLTGKSAPLTDLGAKAERAAANTPKTAPKQGSDAEGSTSDTPTDDATDATPPVAPPASPLPSDDPTEPVEDAGGDIRDGVEGAVDGDPSTSSGSDVVDGVTGLLGSLTDPLLP